MLQKCLQMQQKFRSFLCCQGFKYFIASISMILKPAFCKRWQMIFLISRQSWGLACSRMATATPTSPRSCERQDAWYSLAHGRERCVEQCSPHASATCAVRCEISGGEISGGAPSGPWGRGDVFRLGVATALFCSCARRANTPDTWAHSPRCMIHIDGQFMMVLIEGRTISQGWLAISV